MRKIQIAEELRAEVESETTTLSGSSDGPPSPNRASPSFVRSTPKYHIEVMPTHKSGEEAATEGNHTTILVSSTDRCWIVHDDNGMFAAFFKAVMTSNNPSVSSSVIFRKLSQQDRFKGAKQRLLTNLIMERLRIDEGISY